MRASSGNSATQPEPSIWPLMPTPTAAASRQLKVFPNVSGSGASRLAWFPCPRVTIPTASSCRRRRAPVPVPAGGRTPMTFRIVHQPAANPATKPIPHRRAEYRPRNRVGEPLPRHPLSPPHGSTHPSQATPRRCSTSSAGGNRSTTPLPSRRRRSPSPSCSITCDSSPANSRRLPGAPSISVSLWSTAPCDVYSRKRPARLLRRCRSVTGGAHPWAWADRRRPSAAYG